MISKIIKGNGMEDDISGEGKLKLIDKKDYDLYKIKQEDIKIIKEEKKFDERVLSKNIMKEDI
jgi:hypothetical protein